MHTPDEALTALNAQDLGPRTNQMHSLHQLGTANKHKQVSLYTQAEAEALYMAFYHESTISAHVLIKEKNSS